MKKKYINSLRYHFLILHNGQEIVHSVCHQVCCFILLPLPCPSLYPSLCPSHVPPTPLPQLKESDDRVARMKEMLSKGGGRPLIMPAPRPKPKPKPKPAPVTAKQDTPPDDTMTSANANPDRSLSSSPDRHPVSVESGGRGDGKL